MLIYLNQATVGAAVPDYKYPSIKKPNKKDKVYLHKH